MPPCEVAWGSRGFRRNGDRAAEKGAQRGRRNSYFLISDFALQRAQPLPSLFLPFSPSSRLILVCTEGSVNTRTQEAQFLPGDKQRPLRHRFLPINLMLLIFGEGLDILREGDEELSQAFMIGASDSLGDHGWAWT